MNSTAKPATSSTTPLFTLRDAFKVFAGSILLYAIFSGIFYFLPGTSGILDGIHPAIRFIFEYAVQFVILFFPLWFFVVSPRRASLKDFALTPVPLKKVILTSLACYLFYIVVSIIILSILSSFGTNLPGYGTQESYIPLFGSDLSGLLVGFIFVSILAPFLEEIFFRGFVYRTFAAAWPAWLASAITAVLFAMMHFQFESIIPLIFLGLLLNYAYQKTGSIWTSMAFHSLNNTLAFGLEVYLYFHPQILDSIITFLPR
ncbi:MAG: type II CAAX endopeptidase family protein [Candidatus Gracilibacteria bacterium]|jgi:hypothetical protein